MSAAGGTAKDSWRVANNDKVYNQSDDHMKMGIGDLRAMLRCSGLGAKILLHKLLALTHGG